MFRSSLILILNNTTVLGYEMTTRKFAVHTFRNSKFQKETSPKEVLNFKTGKEKHGAGVTAEDIGLLKCFV